MMLGRRGYDVLLAEATDALGGRVAREARLPGLAAWIRVLDYRKGQLERLPNVELAFHSRLDADEIAGYEFDHVAVATGARWRGDGVGRWHTKAIPLDPGMQVLTPDDLMDGVALRGPRVVLFDDDHYSMGGALAEQLQKGGSQVTYVTSAAGVSQWTQHTMEQPRIQRRLLELSVTIRTSHALISAEAGGATLTCAYTDRESEIECDALVLVTARTPSDSIAADLAGRDGGASVRAVGDAWSPGTIAAAVWDGRRYAEELDEPEESGNEALFRREVVALAPR